MRHVFVSDLHLSDGTLGTSVRENELIRHLLEPIAAGPPTRLVLLGDVFELLRSEAWTPGVEPWKGVSAGFTNFPTLVREKVELITAAIIARYPKFSARLRSLVAEKQVDPVYVPGNHDYMLQLAPNARLAVRRFLSLPESSERFETYYYDRSTSVYAVHGNQYDNLNWHDETKGRWAFGDAIVIRLVNEFLRAASGRLLQPKTDPDTPLAQAIQDLDNVEPSTDLPLYFRYVMERHLTDPADRDALAESWRAAVDSLLALQHFRANEGTTQWALRKTLEASKSETLARLEATLAEHLKKVSRGRDDKYIEDLGLVRATGKPADIFIYGHTHKPGIWPVDGPPERSRYLINTGCWRRVVQRKPGTTDFHGRHVQTLLWIEQDAQGVTRYRLERSEEVT
jgi:UDP-2,3-diacylglucosamine pyrophosphatase LpxH